jgi:hypothetical protein
VLIDVKINRILNVTPEFELVSLRNKPLLIGEFVDNAVLDLLWRKLIGLSLCTVNTSVPHCFVICLQESVSVAEEWVRVTLLQLEVLWNLLSRLVGVDLIYNLLN